MKDLGIMPSDWEREVRYQRGLRREGYTPYSEVRRWRRRAIALGVIGAVEGFLIALGVLWNH